MKKQNFITFQPFGLRSIISSDLSILEAARACGVDITSICGGAGVYDSYRVRLISGNLSKLTPEEESVFTPGEIKNGFRLACQAFPQSDVIIEVPPESISSPQRLQVEGEETSFIIDPSISILDLQLISP